MKTPWVLLSAGVEDLRNPPAGNRPALDVLRTLAISLVLLIHLQPYCWRALFTSKTPFVEFGWTGVDLFFVLSGLLIGGQLCKELKASGTVDLRRFVLRRGLRIWPLYYSLIAFLLAERLFLGRPRPGLWLDATFLSNYYHYFHAHHEIGGGWSLSLEEQFYLLIPILLVVLAKFVRQKTLLYLPLVWLIALPIIRHFALQGTQASDLGGVVTYPFHTRSDGLAVGLLIAWIMTWKPQLLRAGRWLNAVLVLVFLVGCYLWYSLQPTFLFSVVAICYGALTFLSLRIRLPLVLRSRAFYVISRLSYGVYLIHWGLLKHVMAYHARLWGQGFRAFVSAFVIWGAVSLGLAFVTFSFIELPFLRLRERLLARERKQLLPGQEFVPIESK